MENKQPLVSVNVLMYNSSKYILETLESIKAQTYQNIELIMSDDKSTDDTVKICEKWIAKNRDRFVSYQILVPNHNTGQSGNYNRAFRAATGEWIKEIDGDDLLTPNCLTDLMDYVYENPEAKYVFGKIEMFGGNKLTKELSKDLFIYEFFKWSKENQLEQLIYKRNCIPSPSSFYNRAFILDLGFENDEQIPFIEDYPKWIRLLQMGVHFHFCDKTLAKYRLGSGISTSTNCSSNYFKSIWKFQMLYLYPEWEKMDKKYAADRIVDQASSIFQEYNYLRNTMRFKIANLLCKPIDFFAELRKALLHIKDHKK